MQKCSMSGKSMWNMESVLGRLSKYPAVDRFGDNLEIDVKLRNCSQNVNCTLICKSAVCLLNQNETAK